MSTDTRDKLNEASFFHQCLAGEQYFDRYRYFLSAFVSAARSVTLFMQKEYAHEKGFDDWYAKRQEEMKADQDMKFLYNQRGEAIHLSRLKLGEHGAIGKFRIGGETKFEIRDLDTGTTETHVVPSKTVVSAGDSGQIEWAWYFDDHLTKASTQLTAEHLKKLGAMVDNCEKTFGTDPGGSAAVGPAPITK
jgi:hypothetical protein